MKFNVNGFLINYRELAVGERNTLAEDGDLCVCSNVNAGLPIKTYYIISEISWYNNQALLFDSDHWISGSTVGKILKRCVEDSGKACYYFRPASEKSSSRFKMNKYFSEPLPLP